MGRQQHEPDIALPNPFLVNVPGARVMGQQELGDPARIGWDGREYRLGAGQLRDGLRCGARQCLHRPLIVGVLQFLCSQESNLSDRDIIQYFLY